MWISTRIFYWKIFLRNFTVCVCLKFLENLLKASHALLKKKLFQANKKPNQLPVKSTTNFPFPSRVVYDFTFCSSITFLAVFWGEWKQQTRMKSSATVAATTIKIKRWKSFDERSMAKSLWENTRKWKLDRNVIRLKALICQLCSIHSLFRNPSYIMRRLPFL